MPDSLTALCLDRRLSNALREQLGRRSHEVQRSFLVGGQVAVSVWLMWTFSGNTPSESQTAAVSTECRP